MTDRSDPAREDPDRGLDVDAAFADIVARFGPLPEPAAEPKPDPEPEPDPDPAPELAEASWADEGHFVPPEPPALPAVDPRRRVAWVALLGSPVVALLLAMAGGGVSGWVGLLLAGALVGGFGYLVATMRSSPPDDWSDDGARL